MRDSDDIREEMLGELHSISISLEEISEKFEKSNQLQAQLVAALERLAEKETQEWR